MMLLSLARFADAALFAGFEVVDVLQPVVMVQEMEIVTIPVQKVTEIVVVRKVLVSDINNGTALARNGSLPVPALGTVGFRPLYTAATAASGAALPSDHMA